MKASYISEVSPHCQDWVPLVSFKWPFQQVLMGSSVAPQDHASHVASEAVSLIGLVTAKK